MIVICKTCQNGFQARKSKAQPTGYEIFCSRTFSAKSRIGKKLSIEHRSKLSNARKGKEPWNKGKEFTQMIGNKNAFVGDNASRNTYHWRARQLIKKRDRCSVCGKKGESFDIVVHHIDENPSNNEIKNLQLMCRSCHAKHHHSKRKTL